MARARTAARPAAKRKTIKNPGPLDLKKADKVAEEMIRENIEWLKEMAKK